MKADFLDAITAPSADKEFGKKFAFSLLFLLGTPLVVPFFFFLGYLSRTMKHSETGKKGLPEWNDWGDLGIQGGVTFLAGLYLLPAALIAVPPMLLSSSGGLFSTATILSNFIAFGAAIVALAGLACAISALHGYLSTKSVGSLFSVGEVAAKVKNSINDLGVLLFFLAVCSALVGVLNYFLPTVLSLPLSLVSTGLLSLIGAHWAGAIFRSESVETPEKAHRLNEVVDEDPLETLDDFQKQRDDDEGWV